MRIEPRFLSSRRFRYSSWLWLRRAVFWGGALSVGLVAVAFARAATLADQAFHFLLSFSPLVVLVLTPAGLWLSLWLTRRVFPGAEGSGIPQTIAALEITDQKAQGKVLSLRLALGKILLTLLALCCGASVGREGPTVQVGAAIMHDLGRWVRLTRREVQRGLILAGGAAGVAAAFNTPLAGVVFAIEELSRSFEARTNGLVLTAVILAGITSLALVGNYHYFGHTDAGMELGQAWVAVLACGVSGGLLGGIFSQSLILAGRRGLPGPVGRFKVRHPERFAAACGLVLALIGLASGGATYGTGYEQAAQALHGAAPPPGFALEKMLATMASYLSGIPGGIFAPSLSIGAGIGAEWGRWLVGTPAAVLVLLGMVGYFSGVVQAPITAVVIVLEMTDNSNMTIPLLATSVIAYGVSKLICPEPFYKAMAVAFLDRIGKSKDPA